MSASRITKQAVAAIAVAALTAVLLVADSFEENKKYRDILPRIRSASKRRCRPSFEEVTKYLSEGEFRRAFRLTRSNFDHLLTLLYRRLHRDESQASRSSGGVVEPSGRLALTLRILVGGSYIDQMLIFNIARSTVYDVFHDTIRAIVDTLPMPDLRELAEGFHLSRSRPNPLYSCVAALDGIAVEITKPPDDYVPRNFYCRKGMYALPVQALVDSDYRFRFMSCKCVGSTHDFLAFSVSSLARRLRNGEMVPGFWIAGDAAYSCVDGVWTPWTSGSLQDAEDGIFRDSFNYFHSSSRIHIDQAFGMLVNRFGIFWRPLAWHIVDNSPIIFAAMRLHNFAIDNGDTSIKFGTSSDVHEKNSRAAFKAWWTSATNIRNEEGPGRRRDKESRKLRCILTNTLKERGITRPAITSHDS